MCDADAGLLSDEDLLTACVWAEARGEPEEGLKAICNVVFNRVAKRMAQSMSAVIMERHPIFLDQPDRSKLHCGYERAG